MSDLIPKRFFRNVVASGSIHLAPGGRCQRIVFIESVASEGYVSWSLSILCVLVLRYSAYGQKTVLAFVLETGRSLI